MLQDFQTCRSISSNLGPVSIRNMVQETAFPLGRAQLLSLGSSAFSLLGGRACVLQEGSLGYCQLEKFTCPFQTMK